MLILRKAEAETKDVVPAVGIAVETIRHSTAPRIAVPAAATVHTVRARRRSRRIGLRTAAVVSIPVLTPFKHIAAHVVNAEFVRRFGLYVMSY